MQPFQKWIISELYGWREKGTGKHLTKSCWPICQKIRIKFAIYLKTKTLHDRIILYVERRILSPHSVFTLINYVNINVYTNVKGDVKWQIRQYLQ